MHFVFESHVTLDSCFFEISSYSCAYVRVIYEKTKGKSLWEHHMMYWENL